MKWIQSRIWRLATLAVLVMMISTAADAANLARRIGIGYSDGYHAPVACDTCRGHGHGRHFANSAPGCCEFPMTWRTNTWNGYAHEHIPQFYISRANDPTPYTGYYGMGAPIGGLNYPPLPMGFDSTTIPLPPPDAPLVGEPTPAPGK